MDRKGKGKQVAGTDSYSGGKKRKGGVEVRDEGLRISKRKTPAVLQFFEESAELGYYGGSSDEDCDVDDFLNDMEDEPYVEANGQDDKGKKGDSSFVFPKEEEINEDEYDRIMEERYKPGSGFVRYADDDVKSSIEMDALVPTAQDPPLWKVKCAGGGAAIQKGLNPAPSLISSSELDEFRPLIQVRRDRDTGITFEHLDSLMLKDGFLYKKVSLDSLSSWGVTPSKEDILKFTPAEQKEPGDVEWISKIYGEEKKKKILPTGSVGGKGEESGGEKGEGASGSTSESSYELYNLVCFSRKDFGLTVGVDEKGDGYKVLKEGSDGPVVVSVGKKEMQNGPFDSKFTALDLNNKQISINDVVKISKGPSEGKQGVVKQVYRGILFLYAESEEENGGYFCCKSQSCEKIKLFTDESNEKAGGFDASAFGDSASSPKSLLPPEKEWQPKEKYIKANQGDKGSMYFIGQKLRIRVGPLKGYLCRVIALRYSDVTVKLDSQHKILTVKSEHLAEVRDRNMLSKRSAWGSKPTSDVSPTVPDDNTSTWANAAAENKAASAGGWNSWNKPGGGGSSWGKQHGGGDGSSCGRGGSSLGKQNDTSAGSSGGKQNEADGGGDSRGWIEPKKRHRARFVQRFNSVYPVANLVDVFLDLETVGFKDIESARSLLSDINAILESKKPKTKDTKYHCGTVNVYAIQSKSKEDDAILSILDDLSCIKLETYHQRKLICGACIEDRKTKGETRGIKHELAQLEMLSGICLHALKLRRIGNRKNIMIISNDRFFTDKLVPNLEKKEHGGFEVFTDLPSGMIRKEMYQ